MPRLMAVSLTEAQVRDRTKTVTRRLGWLMLKPGDQLTLCRKVMGRKPGEPLDRIATVEVVSVRREPLDAITPSDVAAEGFPGKSPVWFVTFFCATHRGCLPSTEVTRIEWRYPGQPGQVHESIAGVDLTGPFTGRPGLDAVIAVEPHGRDLERELLVIRRTVTWAGDGLEQITPETIAPPTDAETTALNAALDYLGYTGPRRISLLLAVHHA